MAARSASVKRAVDTAIRNAHLTPREEGTAALAKRLAAEIDAADDPELVAKLSARLLPTLEALGMTRRMTSTAANGGEPGVPVSAIDQLRARRARIGNAPSVDPAAPGPRRTRS